MQSDKWFTEKITDYLDASQNNAFKKCFTMIR